MRSASNHFWDPTYDPDTASPHGGTFDLSVTHECADADSVYTVNRSGTDIYSSADQLNYVYWQLNQNGKFSFITADSDSDDATQARVDSLAAPTAGQWYYVTGEYDQSAGEIRLYVDGQLQGEAAFDSDWSASGHTIIGAGQSGGSRTNYFSGEIDDVDIEDTVWTPSQISTAAGLTDTEVPNGLYVYNIGSPTLGGSATYDAANGAFNLAGSGNAISGDSDQFSVLTETYGGDGSLEAELTALAQVNGTYPDGATAGVIYRDSTDEASPFVSLVYTNGAGLQFLYRDESRTAVQQEGGDIDVSPDSPIWVRVVRSGEVYTAYYATSDSLPVGSGWTEIGSVDVAAIGDSSLAGMVVSSNDASTVATAQFSNVSLIWPAATPTGVTAAAGAGENTLTWDTDTGSTSFNIYRSTTSGGEGSTPYATDVTGTTFTDDDVTAGTTYYYEVSGVNDGGESTPSSEVSATAEEGSSPAAPTGLAVTAGDGQNSLTWDAVTGATSYNVYRATTSGGEGSTPYATDVTDTSFVDSGLTNGTTYYYQVTAVNDSGESSASSEMSGTPQNQLAITIGGSSSATEGAPYSLEITVAGANSVDTDTLSVDWGDGNEDDVNVSGLIGAGGGTIPVSHVYDEAGTMDVQVTSTIDGTEYSSSGQSISVSHAAPSVSISGPALATAGSAYTLNLSASETGDETVTGWTINWGDGTEEDPDLQTVTGNPSSADHTYSSAGDYVISATASDADGTYDAAATVAVTAYPLSADISLASASIQATATELFAGPIATFTDSDTSATPDGFNWSINWGDGASTDAGGNASGSADMIYQDPDTGLFTLYGVHTYAQTSDTSGPYAISISITDGSAIASIASSATVTQLSPLNNQSLEPQAGQAITGTVASFYSLNGDDVAGDFSGTIDWGDGDTSPAVIAAGTDANGNAIFNVSPESGYTYATSGSYTATVSLTDSASGESFSMPLAVSVDPATLAPTGESLTASTGVALSGVTVATFTSGNSLASASDFSAIIGWGDGGETDGTIVSDPDGGFDVLGSYTYNASGAMGIDVSISNAADGGYTDVSSSASVSTGTLYAANNQTLEVSGDEAYSGVVATFSSANSSLTSSDFSGTIDWGDGDTSPAVFAADGTDTNGNNVFSVSPESGYTYDYSEAGDQFGAVSVSDGSGNSLAIPVDITVDSAPITATGTSLSATTGVALDSVLLATFADSNSSLAASDFEASIDWGDGSALDTGTISADLDGGFDVYGSHNYAIAGTQTITVYIGDDVNSAESATTTASVAAGTLYASSGQSIEPQAEAAFTGMVATFSSADSTLSAGAFTATIDWGDGDTSNAAVASDGTDGNGNNLFSVTPISGYSYPYSGEGVATVNINDGNGDAIAVPVSTTIDDASTPTPTAPDAPTGLTATALSPSEIELNWTAPADADPGSDDPMSYVILRSTVDSPGYFSSIDTVYGTTYIDDNAGNDLAGHTTYYYEVQAVNDIGSSGDSSVASATTRDNAPVAYNYPGNPTSDPDSVWPEGTLDINLQEEGADADGDSLSIDASKLPSTTAHGGTLTDFDGEYIVYTPPANFLGTDTFTFQLTDGYEDSNVATASIQVVPEAIPTANGGYFEQYPAYVDGVWQSYSAPTNGQVYAQSQDSSNLTYTVVSGPSHGSFAFTDNEGDFTYTPDNSYSGTVLIAYKVNDGSMDSPVASITILGYTAIPNGDSGYSFNPRPGLPATGLSAPDFTIFQGQELDVSAADGALYGVPDDGAPWSAQLVNTDPGNPNDADRQVIVNSDGSFSFLPAPGFVGTDWITFQVQGGYPYNYITTEINVDPVTVGLSISGQTEEQSATTGATIDYDPPVDGDPPNINDMQSLQYFIPAYLPSGTTLTLSYTRGGSGDIEVWDSAGINEYLSSSQTSYTFDNLAAMPGNFLIAGVENSEQLNDVQLTLTLTLPEQADESSASLYFDAGGGGGAATTQSATAAATVNPLPILGVLKVQDGSEAGPNGTTTDVIFDIERNRASDQPLTVYYYLAGNAVLGVNYTAPSTPVNPQGGMPVYSVVIPAGESVVQLHIHVLIDSDTAAKDIKLVFVPDDSSYQDPSTHFLPGDDTATIHQLVIEIAQLSPPQALSAVTANFLNIDSLVSLLDDDNFNTREAATKLLENDAVAFPVIIPILQEDYASQEPPETHGRLAVILRDIQLRKNGYTASISNNVLSIVIPSVAPAVRLNPSTVVVGPTIAVKLPVNYQSNYGQELDAAVTLTPAYYSVAPTNLAFSVRGYQWLGGAFELLDPGFDATYNIPLIMIVQ